MTNHKHFVKLEYSINGHKVNTKIYKQKQNRVNILARSMLLLAFSDLGVMGDLKVHNAHQNTKIKNKKGEYYAEKTYSGRRRSWYSRWLLYFYPATRFYLTKSRANPFNLNLRAGLFN